MESSENCNNVHIISSECENRDMLLIEAGSEASVNHLVQSNSFVNKVNSV